MRKRKTPIAKDLSKKFANQIYDAACAEPYLWLEKAREMRRAADLIWDQFHKEIVDYTLGGEYTGEPFTGDVAMMLYGFTIENMLKAGLVGKGIAVKPNGNFELTSHDLEYLATELSVKLCSEEQELLERLEAFLVWAGRYPIPRFKDDLYPQIWHDGSKGSIMNFGTSVRESIDCLIAKIQASLPDDNAAITSYVRFCTGDL